MLQTELSACPKKTSNSTGNEADDDADGSQPPPQKKPQPSLFSHYTDSHSVPADMEDSRRLEKILAHYIDTINSVSFDRSTVLDFY